jgi:hypothetical protein
VAGITPEAYGRLWQGAREWVGDHTTRAAAQRLLRLVERL